MKTMRWILTAATILCLMAASCGYRLVGGGYLDGNVTQVAVLLFENNSSESRAATSFTNELIREITERTDTKVVDQANATRQISGIIKAITFATLSRSSSETVTERQVTAVVDVKLTGPNGKILWSVKDFSASETYTTATDSVDDEANKRQAVETIANRVSERLVNQMISKF